MAAYKFTFSRKVVMCEVYEILADSELEACDAMSEGWYGDPVDVEFIEWYDDDFYLDRTEVIDPLHKMLVSYEKDKTVDNSKV
jgi:hypothetical protein